MLLDTPPVGFGLPLSSVDAVIEALRQTSNRHAEDFADPKQASHRDGPSQGKAQGNLGQAWLRQPASDVSERSPHCFPERAGTSKVAFDCFLLPRRKSVP